MDKVIERISIMTICTSLLSKTILLSVVIFCSHCSPDFEYPQLPAASFDFSFDIATSPYNALQTSLTGIVVGKGQYGYQRNGILMFRYIYDSDMFAYDATCPQPECIAKNQSLTFDSKTIAVCRNCKQQYDLLTGLPTAKNAKYRLKPYHVTQETDFRYRVSGQ